MVEKFEAVMGERELALVDAGDISLLTFFFLPANSQANISFIFLTQ